MGRRRKRRKKIRKKPRKPSRYFHCPVCGNLTLTITFKKIQRDPQWKLAIAKCGTCKLHCVLRVRSNVDRIDVYNRIVDLYHENRLEECMPKPQEEIEREIEEIIEEEEQYETAQENTGDYEE